MARALSGEKVYPFVILSVCVSLVLSRGRARLRVENLFARPLAVPCLWRAPPPPPVSVGRCWTEESPGEFVQSEPKEKDVSDAADFAPPRPAGYASA